MDHKNMPGRRAGAIVGGALLAGSAIAVSAASTAQAAAAPTVQLAFSPTTISAGTSPQMTFMSQNVPSGALLYLQESSNGGQQWKTIDKTADTQATADIAALPEGDYEFRILITVDNTVLGASAPAPLTVTGADGAMPVGVATATQAPPAPTTVPSPAPSGSGVPWLKTVVKSIWDAIWDVILGWILSLF